jgi:methyl-accepting chemotaxis protein
MISIQFSNWPIGRKLAALIAFVILTTLLGAASMLYAKHESMLQAKREQTRNLVEVAHGIVALSHEREKSGELTRAQAQKQAVDVLRKLRYGQNEYFWINDMQPRMVMHPIKPELDGQDLSASADPKGKKLFVAFVDEVRRSGAGYVDYMWPKPGVSAPVDKVSYVKGFAPWGWVIGSGIYVDDVDAQFWADTRISAIGTLLCALLLIVLAWLVSGSITRPLAKAVAVTDAVAKGDLNHRFEADAQATNETGQLLRSVQRMVATLNAFVEAQKQMAVAHGAGAIDEQIDADRYAGVYGDMARSINELVGSHIAVKMRVVDIVKQYAQGDLSADMDRLPGKKAQITDAIDNVKRSLMAVNGEIKRLEGAALEGDFTVRGDAAKYKYEFREMVEGLNHLMESNDAGLSEVARVLEALAKGDLSQRITREMKGTFHSLKQDTNSVVDKLNEILGQIRDSTESINVAAKEIASGNTDLSSRTEQQASSLEETASSMEELTGTVQQNAENARQANQLAAGASEVALKGGEVVSQVVLTMGSINASSKKIVDIISVIDGIAFQTNILALNAAVEAARAGEQGRGFAVVANEVRTLAQRSAAAAKEIKSLINDSVEKVASGTELVDEAGKTMQEIVASVKRVTDIMAEIAAASHEQSGGIVQVNQAIAQMDDVTQQNAALVEQAAAAAESLEEQAGNLAAAVKVFKLAESGGRRAVLALPPAASEKPRPAPQKKASVVQHPSAAPKTANAAGGAEEWAEF